MPNIRFTVQALECLTTKQAEALARLARGVEVRGIDVQFGGFDLPNGYVGFRVDYVDGQPMYGGVSPEGEVST